MITPKQPAQADELCMKSDDFDRVMRGALGVHAPPTEPKGKTPKSKPKAAKKVTSKK